MTGAGNPAKARPRRTVWAVAVIAIAVAIAATLALRGREIGPQAEFDPAVHVPSDALAVAWTGPLGRLADGLSALAGAVRGAEGLVDAARMLLDVRSVDSDGLDAAGLSSGRGAVGFVWQGASWLVLPVGSSAGAEHVLGLLRRRGHPVVVVSTDGAGGGSWAIRDRADRHVLGHARWRDGVLLVRAAAPLPMGATLTDADPAALSAWAAAPKLPSGGLEDPGSGVAARWNIGPDDPVRRQLRRSLGPAALLFGRYVGSFTRAEAKLRLDAAGVSLRARLYGPEQQAAEIKRYHHDFIESDAALMPLGEVLPDETTALARLRLNPKLVAMASTFLAMAGGIDLGAVDRSLRTLDAKPLLLDTFDGQLALALLGVSDEATVDPSQWRGYRWREHAGLAIGVTLRTDQDAIALLDRVRGRLDQEKARFSPLSLGKWQGIARRKGVVAWGLARQRRHVLFILGNGEIERLERVAAGKFPSLGAVAATELQRAAMDGKPHWLAVIATTGRTVRSARRRGVPDAITAMIGSVKLVAAGVQLHADGATLDVELAARARPGSKR